MFMRFILGRTLPVSLQITKTAQTTKHYCRYLSIHEPSVCIPRQISVAQRSYSREAAAEVMNVDFDYVKNATSDNNTVIVDVREPDEIKEHGKIPNSINIPLGSVTTVLQMPNKEFEQVYNRQKPSEDTEIIFYCMIGKRSGKAQDSAQKLGFRNAKNYLGSFTDWAAKTK